MVLLAYECGAGLGHLNRLAEVARGLRARGLLSLLASYRLDDVDRFAAAFDEVVQAPVWPFLLAGSPVDTQPPGPSFATALANMGFHRPNYVAANQRAWRAILERWDVRTVVACYAPGAILAAKGFCSSMQVGAPFYTAALAGGVFPPFLPELQADGKLEAQFMGAIGEANARLGRPAPSSLQDAVIGDESLPMAFAEFDPYRSIRREPLLAPDLGAPPAVERYPGDKIYFYLPEWMQRHDVVMATLYALKVPRKIFIPDLVPDLKSDLENRGAEVSENPFSMAELARSARVFVHHGGLGSSQIGLMAGVPQIALANDMEKIVNARALVSLGVGRTIDFSRLTLPKLREQVTAAFEDAEMQARAAERMNEFRRRLSGPNPIDLAVERIAAIVRN